MNDRLAEADFEKRVERLSTDLIEVVRAHLARGAHVDAVLEALAAVLGTTVASTVRSIDDLERSLEIAALRVQQSAEDAFVHDASALPPSA